MGSCGWTITKDPPLPILVFNLNECDFYRQPGVGKQPFLNACPSVGRFLNWSRRGREALRSGCRCCAWTSARWPLRQAPIEPATPPALDRSQRFVVFVQLSAAARGDAESAARESSLVPGTAVAGLGSGLVCRSWQRQGQSGGFLGPHCPLPLGHYFLILQ